MMKECKGCGLPKELEEFVKDKRYSDGTTSKCKLCIRKQRKKRSDERRAKMLGVDKVITKKPPMELSKKPKKLDTIKTKSDHPALITKEVNGVTYHLSRVRLVSENNGKKIKHRTRVVELFHWTTNPNSVPKISKELRETRGEAHIATVCNVLKSEAFQVPKEVLESGNV